jgi:hypothetical protein
MADYTGSLIDWAQKMLGYDVEESSATKCTRSRYCPNAGSSKEASLRSDGMVKKAEQRPRTQTILLRSLDLDQFHEYAAEQGWLSLWTGSKT